MTEDKATRAAALLNEIRWTKDAISRLKEARAAKMTGLDPHKPGPKTHVLQILDYEWGRLGEKCVAFFIKAMDEAVTDEETYLAGLVKELEEL